MTLAVGTSLGRYKIRSKLGEGGIGEVYRARDEKLNRDVAIKVLPASLSQDPERLRRFEQEAQAAGALNHPNILGVFDVGTHDGLTYLVAELLEGEELRERLNRGPMPQRKAIELAQQIAAGLAAAHEKGIVHRDLKPENLFVTTTDRVKILDFGLAKLSEPKVLSDGSKSEAATRRALTDPGTVMGTVGYMSPEQVRGHQADHRSDIFSDFNGVRCRSAREKMLHQAATRVDDSSPTNQQRRSQERADSNGSRIAPAGDHEVELPACYSTSRQALI